MSSKDKILIKAKSLFAKKGFANVSMRNLAKEVEMSVASIYHHFPDKNALYLETVKFAFKDKEKVFSEIWGEESSFEQKLELFIYSLIQVLYSDREFHRIIQREIIDADPERMKVLADDVFKDQFLFLLALLKQISPEKDAHLLAISVLSLCKHHLEMEPLRRFLPEWKLEHEQPDVLAKHVMDIIKLI